MKIDKSKKYKLQRKTRFKRIVIGTSIALLIAAGIFIPKISARNNVKISYNSITTQDIENDCSTIYNDADFFANRKSYYEYDYNNELNDVIREIRKINYSPTDEYFINYSMYNLPSKEIEVLKSNGNDITSIEEYDINYNWYNNGKIDSDKLYQKIINNSTDASIKVNVKVKEITKCFCDNLQDCMDYIKSKQSNYDFNIALKNIDNLCISDISGEKYMGWYSYVDNELKSDYIYTKDKNLFKYNIIHETFHLLENKLGYNDNYYISGFNIEAMETDESPLFFDFMCERFTDQYACDLCSDISVGYKQEKRYIDYLCLSTNNNYNYFNNAFLNGDQNDLIFAFEPEFQDFNYIYSTLEGLDLACGYGYVPEGCNEDLFRTDAYFYSKVNLLKNGYVRIIKDMINGAINYDDANKQINNLKKQVLVDKYYKYKENSNSIKELNRCVDELDSLFYEYHYSKSM